MQPCLVITPSAYVGASKLSPYEVAVATGIGSECSGCAYRKVRAGGWEVTRVRHSKEKKDKKNSRRQGAEELIIRGKIPFLSE
jgi:hypothetical protein